MDYKLELFVKELELDKIRDKKNLAVKNMEYTNAAHLRDLEKEKEHEIQEILYNLQKYFNETPLAKYNFDELEEISKLIFLYQSDKNNLFKKKIKLTIKNLKNEKEQALLTENFNLRAKFNAEIKYLKEQLNK
ncbi:MAG: UvrB/UvrC motif-containing protein [Flavobacteriaceae bacterium]